ncbi:MAG: conjugal transfer protein TraL [Proteobacteria bacterium]|nr:conjugal transfer protein TraL [Pseudomonadota bacterium]MBU2630802.1 conjugal transfer protein TraL [Pseudomonadota bacterium]
MQGKGGVGKSVVASLLAQFLQEKSNLCCIDTDPINPTFSKFKNLKVNHLNLLSAPNKINERIFDQLIENILSANKNFIIDNGAGGFLAISNYIIENDIISVLADFDVFVHIPIVGGQAFKETANGLVSISKQFDEKTKIVLWINEYFGKLNEDLKEYKFYKAIENKLLAKIILPEQSIDTFGEDIKMMFTANKTFNEIAQDESLKFMVKRRLNIFKEQIFVQLEEGKICA